MDGEDSDALGAYHQTILGGPPTWIQLPKHRWPKHLHGKYTDPVVRLRINLYGHPLAGLYWDKFSQENQTNADSFQSKDGSVCTNTRRKVYFDQYT